MRRFYSAALAAVLGAALSWIGLIHAGQVAWAAQPPVALGYALLAVVLVAFAVHQQSQNPAVEESDDHGAPGTTRVDSESAVGAEA